MIAVAALLFAMPRGTDFWLTFVALVGLLRHARDVLALHATGEQVLGRGPGIEPRWRELLFDRFEKRNKREAGQVGWTELRDRWEYSQVMRAALSTGSLFALVIAVT